MMKKLSLAILMLAILPVSLLSGCDRSTQPRQPKKDKVHLVDTIRIERSDIKISQLRTGTLKALHEVDIFSQEEGRIMAMPYYESDVVKKGDVIVELDGSLLRAQLDQAIAKRQQAELNLKRLQDLFKKKLAAEEALIRSKTELAVARADEAQLRIRYGYTRIESPIDGVISARNSEPGNIAERYAHLLTVSDLGSLVTRLEVSGLLLPELSVGQPANVRIDALGDRVFPGRISRIHPNLDPVSRRGTVEIELVPVPPGARPGQLCRVRLDRQIHDRLMIPFRALRRDRDSEYVFLVTADNTAQRTPVISGQRIAEQVEIIHGLEAGQRIVVRGFLDLVDGNKVTTVADSAQQAGAQSE